MNSGKLLGVVLCGGQSTRMGNDKGLIQFNGTTWAQIARDKLSSLSLETILSINQNQLSPYSTFINTSDLIIDHSEINVGGPLKGLFSIHSKFPEHDLLVLACDLPKMQLEVLNELMDQYTQQIMADAIVFTKNDRIEPLCGIYRASGLSKIYSAYLENKLVRHSMIKALEALSTHFISIKPEWESSFQNMNSVEDLSN
jgi:molybdenum cofactor guanylyltransferase